MVRILWAKANRRLPGMMASLSRGSDGVLLGLYAGETFD